MTREEWEVKLQLLGATVKKSTTRDTDVVLVGIEPGSGKLEKAKKYGIPTMHFFMADYLGLFERRSTYQLRNVEQDVVNQVILQMAVTLDELFGEHIRTGRNDLWRSFERGVGALDELLQTTYGPVRTSEDDEEPVSPSSLIGGIRAQYDASVRGMGEVDYGGGE